jgi:geranylgeranyl pyrophosphate synthase/predicted secreted hydrolase
VHDLPHESSVTEWWYLNTHFTDADGNDYSAFAAFFRVVKHTEKETGKRYFAHALNWAITDVKGKKYVQESIIDKDAPAIVKQQLQDDKLVRDPRLKRAYLEVLDRGNVPLPDRLFKDGKDPVVAMDRLFLDYEGADFTKDKDGNYLLRTRTPDGKQALDLTFRPKKAAVRHGLDGVVKGHDGDDMFYYFIPRCDVTGTVTVDGERKTLKSGSGWYDHEFGGKRSSDTDVPSMNYAWNWAALQLDNGYELSLARLVDPRATPHREMERRAVVVDPTGARTQPDDMVFQELDAWTSVRSFNTYPTKWRITLPSAGIDLLLEAPFPDQEFMTLIAKPAFWEGRVEVTGTVAGKAVRGVGYIERNGFQVLSELDSFFKAVGKETRRAVMEVYPDIVDREVAVNLIATPETQHYVDGVDFQTFHDGVIAPVRYISDMGGKSWRSYGALACMDVVGGDSRKFTRWLSMPEFMHVGSLIIDDIEDKSTKRRGVPCAHIKFGEAVAINSGTAAFFQGQQLLLVPGLNAEQLNRVYEYYFAALRAGHAGQALDIAGLDYLMEDVIERGDYALAESRIIGIHRLKTAVPAASLARMGALVGGGTNEQIEAVGYYYESVGIAFQIMDDVLNLRGLYSGKADVLAGVELKNLGEDIGAGKVTIPVVKAMSRLPKAEMRALWEVIKTKPQDRATIDRCIAILEKCGAIDACVEQAQQLVEDSFKRLDPTIPDSFSKIMLRSFGWFVTERAT